jgi:hypothetical protein
MQCGDIKLNTTNQTCYNSNKECDTGNPTLPRKS